MHIMKKVLWFHRVIKATLYDILHRKERENRKGNVNNSRMTMHIPRIYMYAYILTRLKRVCEEYTREGGYDREKRAGRDYVLQRSKVGQPKYNNLA